MSALFVITRVDPADDPLARAAERTHSVLRLALLGTEPGRDRERFAGWIRKPPPHAAVAWTSRRAGEALAEMALPRHRELLAGIPLFAVGMRSAAPIRDLGLTVRFIEENPSAGMLAGLILGHRKAQGLARVAYLHGDRFLRDLPDALRAARIEVEMFELYRTRFLSPDVALLEAALARQSPVVVLFSSPSGVEALERILPPGSVEALRRTARTAPRGPTTRRALLARGYPPERMIQDGRAGFDPSALEALQLPERNP